MSEHVLKIHEQPFNDLLSGEKTAEIRNNDRGFQVGDTVQLHEIADSYTGRVMHRQVTHVQTGYGLPDGLCVLSYAPLISALKEGQGEAVATISWRQPSCEWTLNMLCEIAIGEGVDVPLYLAPPASADAVSVPRELLKELIDAAEYGTGINNHELIQARALLAQSE